MSLSAKVISINVSMPKEVEWDGETVLTGIFKEPRSPGKVWVRRLNIDGDGQADLRVHGGVDKAVYAYSADAFPWWKARLQREIKPGAFGENLTLGVFPEDQVHIGDIFRVGQAELQVAQPRVPCFKLGIKFGDMGVLRTFFESRRPGVYFRVLQEGEIEAGQNLERIKEDPEKVSILTLAEIYRGEIKSREILEHALQAKCLLPDWHRVVSKRLAIINRAP